MINLITDQQPWTKNQIRKRVEAHIAQIQTHGDEQLLTRVNDALLLGVLPADYDASGAESYRNERYLPRALEGGELADKMAADNKRLGRAIGLQAALSGFAALGEKLEGDSALPPQIKNEAGEVVDNPALLAAAVEFGDALTVINAATADDWRIVAQRIAGAEIVDPVELNLSVVRILPTPEALTAYVEGGGLGVVDGRMTLENAREKVIGDLTPKPLGEEVENQLI